MHVDVKNFSNSVIYNPVQPLGELARELKARRKVIKRNPFSTLPTDYVEKSIERANLRYGKV